jgi:hypothetical protein
MLTDKKIARRPCSPLLAQVIEEGVFYSICRYRISRTLEVHDRTNGFSKDLTWFEKQLWLSLAYYHLVLPHQGLRERFPTPEPTRGAGSPRIWRPLTPAMAAGLTDHVWTTEELLAYRVPVEFLDQLRTIEHLFPEWNGVHHSN